MTTQLMMWPVLQCEKAPRNCDEREAQGAFRNKAEEFALVMPEPEPRQETVEGRERREARLREVAAAKMLK